MLSLLVTLLIVFAILGIAWWAINQIPMPQPMRTVAVVIFALIAIVVLLNMVGGVHLRALA